MTVRPGGTFQKEFLPVDALITRYAVLGEPGDAVFDPGATTTVASTQRRGEGVYTNRLAEFSAASVQGADEQLRIFKSTPPQVPSAPQLVALKQQESASVERLLQGAGSLKGHRLESPEVDKLASSLKDSILRALRLKHVYTPATGNCLVLSVVQALANDDMCSMEEVLLRSASGMQRGLKYTGQLHMTDQFEYAERFKILVNVRRGWMAMSTIESAKQFKRYLEEYAANASDRVTLTGELASRCL